MQPHVSDDGRAAAEGARGLPWTGTETSHTFPPSVIGQIHEMADVGRYEIRGWGAKRQLPTTPANRWNWRSPSRSRG